MPLYGHINYDILCRYREFVISMAQISSAWVVVIISMDRWIRTRFPFQSKILCTPRKALIPVTILVFVDISHMLTPLFGQLLSGVALVACGPNLQNIYYLDFYYFTWTIMQVRCVFFLQEKFK